LAACAALACTHDCLLGFPCRKRFALPALRRGVRIGIWMFVFVPHPSGWAEEHSRKRIRAGTCLSAASLCLTPFSASTAGCPGAQRRGPGPSGRLSFGYFSLATQRKVPRPPGRDPACGQATAPRNKLSRRQTWIPDQVRDDSPAPFRHCSSTREATRQREPLSFVNCRNSLTMQQRTFLPTLTGRRPRITAYTTRSSPCRFLSSCSSCLS